MSPRFGALTLGLLSAIALPPVHAQDAATQALIEQGRYWQARGDHARAAEAWNKLLQAQPGSAQALYGLARAELGAGRIAAAEALQRRLQAAADGSELARQLAQEIRLQRHGGQVESARALARSGRPERAVAEYRAALGTAEPTGPIALEYYQTLGSTAAGWDAARRGLEQLARQAPDDPEIALALAQHLTYREASRREGISQLQRLASHPAVGRAASDSWRKALAWTGSRPADAKLYEDFLRVHPEDTAVRARLAEVQRQERQRRADAAASADPLRRRSSSGFEALERGELEAAEAAFQEVLARRPADGDALGGMGLVQLRRERFAEARDFLERASRQGAKARWQSALDSATYWSLVEQAQDARDAGRPEDARKLLQQATQLAPREVTAENQLADLLVELGQYDEAEAAYRRVLARRARHIDAIRGLVGVLARNGKAGEALALVQELSPQEQAQVGSVGRLRATQALGQARAAIDRGEDAQARVLLEDALLNDPANPWIRLELARLYLRLGTPAQARSVMDGLLQSHPNLPEALYASALLASEAQDWNAALALLERIPADGRTRDILALEQRARVHVQASAASALAAEGRRREALEMLTRIEPQVEQDAELLGALATAYVDVGDSRRALALIRQLMARTPRAEAGLRLQYAAILLRSGQDIELAGVLRQLQAAPLNANQRRDYERLRRAYIVRQADALREAGDLELAYDTLAPLLVQYPDDSEIQGALARMYAANGDFAEALALYRRMLEREPNALPLMLQAGAMASQAGEYGYAESVLQVALARAPRDPQVLTALGRLYRAKGDYSQATEYLTAAVRSEDEQRRRTLQAGGASLAARAGNPFARGRARPVAWAAPALQRPPGAAFDAAVPQAAAEPWLPAPAAAEPWLPAPAAAARPTPLPLPPLRQQGPDRPAADYAAGRPGGAADALGGAAVPLPAARLREDSGWNAPPRQAAASGWNAPPRQPPASGWNAPPPASTARDELRELRQDRVTTLSVGSLARMRQGEAGLSEARALEAPVELQFAAGDGRMTLGLTPATVSAGSAATDYGTISRFGGGPAAAMAFPGIGAGSQSGSGAGVQVRYEQGGFQGDLGTTPLGFRRSDVTGGLRYELPLGAETTLRLGASRRPVTDSVLSFAGARDGRTGETWGGVAATGGRLDLTWDDGEFGAYGYGSVHALTGSGVQSNTRSELGGGLYWHLHRTAQSDLTAGLNFSALAYRHNLRYFTPGHGGYFSPQQFVAMNIPVQWSQRSGKVSYRLDGSLGVQHFREDPAAYFPLDAARQSAAAAAAADAEAFGQTGASAIYPGQTKTGLAYSLGAALEYRIHPQLSLGGRLGIQNARDYKEFVGGLYLRYALEPAATQPDYPVTPLRSPYGGD